MTRENEFNNGLLSLLIGAWSYGIYIRIISDWLHTHKINPKSKLYKGHLDSTNHYDILNSADYTIFERNHGKQQWWIDKKARIGQDINDYNSGDPMAKAKAEAQTEVRIIIRHID